MKNLFAVALFIALAMNLTAQTEKRIALVIGNSNYASGGVLKNPVNDANLMAATLTELGFTVIKRTNATKQQLDDVVIDFSRKIANYETVLFYYAGHGMQIDGSNYLIPVDADNSDELAIKKKYGYKVSDVIEEFEKYKNHVNIVILDACRDNPFLVSQRGGDRGFKVIQAPSGTLIAFATAEGKTAADGTGNNGLYTENLVKQLKVPQRIEDVFIKTRVAVSTASGGKQNPQEWSSINVTGFSLLAASNNSNVKPIVNATTNDDETVKPIFNPGKVKVAYGGISINSEIAGTLYINNTEYGAIAANSTDNNIEKLKVTSEPYTIEIRGSETFTTQVYLIKDQAITINAKSTKKKATNINNAKDLPDRFADERDGKSYKLVVIGTQTWMAENLAYKANEGCWAYDNDESNAAKYGYLYNFETANKVCPSGWHLPSDKEWTILTDYLGGEKVAGGKLKATTDWKSSNTDATNTSKFAALPVGYRNNSSGAFANMGSYGSWWSKTASEPSDAYARYLSYNYANAGSGTGSKQSGFAVRCLKD